MLDGVVTNSSSWSTLSSGYYFCQISALNEKNSFYLSSSNNFKHFSLILLTCYFEQRQTLRSKKSPTQLFIFEVLQMSLLSPVLSKCTKILIMLHIPTLSSFNMFLKFLRNMPSWYFNFIGEESLKNCPTHVCLVAERS